MKVFVVIPHWNGPEKILACLKSLHEQAFPHTPVVVDNGSVDDSVEQIKKRFPTTTVIEIAKNTGFAGGVNAGIDYALKNNADAVALLNNDATPERKWLKHLVETLKRSEETGIVTGLFLQTDKMHIDSTGDIYTTWGLPYPRQRGENSTDAPQESQEVFGATGGASLYRSKMLRQVGLFDQKFFAYLEDVDISWRAQLYGWKVIYEPKAVAYHQIGGTSRTMKGFSTYHYIKNLPMLFCKNVPLKFIPHILPRLLLAYSSIFLKSLLTGKSWYALKGLVMFVVYIPHTFAARFTIQRSRKVSDDYIWSILTHDLPPNASNLRRLRAFFTGR